MNTNNDSNFIGRFAGSLMDQRTEVDPDPSRADNLHVSGCTPHLDFDAATRIPTKEESLYQKVYRQPLVKESFSLITEMVVRSTMIVRKMSGS